MDKVSYALGMGIGAQLMGMGAEKLNIDDFAQAIKDCMSGKTQMTNSEAQKVAQDFFAEQEKVQRAKAAELGKAAREKGEQYLAENAKKEGVITTVSGLQYKVITMGKGEKPTENSQVKVHYRGTLIDGTEFDSSYARNEPATFRANQVIPGWTEALQLMPVGSKWMLYIPQELGYGNREAGDVIKPFSTLIFEVELLEIVK